MSTHEDRVFRLGYNAAVRDFWRSVCEKRAVKAERKVIPFKPAPWPWSTAQAMAIAQLKRENEHHAAKAAQLRAWALAG